MGGFFGVVSKTDCVLDLFFGTDYHSHLGTSRGGLAVLNGDVFERSIHDITNAQFRSKFEKEADTMKGASGIGIISDFEDQPLIIHSHLGTYAIATVGVIKNADELIREAFRKHATHFSEMSIGSINPTELAANLINDAVSFEDGLRNLQQKIRGSCSVLLLTQKGIYAARDRYGRTPVIIGQKEGSWAVTMETSAFPNLNYEKSYELGPGEAVLLDPEGSTRILAPGPVLQICAFLWVYYGYPASSYEDINVELCRYRCGAALARRDTIEADMVAGIPDSGTGHAIGYSNEKGLPHARPFVKYTPTWARSFMPQDQRQRERIAQMKLIPIREMIKGKRIVFCDDSIVRGTQLRDVIERLFEYGAREVHMRPACPPLVFGCKFLNFSRSRSELDLAGRRAIKSLESRDDATLGEYADPDTDKHAAMVAWIGKQLKLSTLRYQRLDDLIEAIGLPADKVCTYCWNGREIL